jgi:hypothetical protein
LATTYSRLSPLEDYEASRFSIEFLHKPLVPNNIINWRVFDGDEYIIFVLNNEETFMDLNINDEVFQEMIAG